MERMNKKTGLTFKRWFDIAASGTALILLSPIMALVALAVRLESKGPVLYGALRAGQGYRLFRLLKFRTMYVGADQAVKNLQHLNAYGPSVTPSTEMTCDCKEQGLECTYLFTSSGEMVCEKAHQRGSQSKAAFFKIKDDPRITRVGKFLRNTSLDELPQLINVLRGDMSLVGNRPLPLYEAEQLTGDEAALRFLAPAGITGLWQVTKRGRKGEMTDRERIELDKEYAREYSFVHDAKLIMKTFPALLQKESM